MSSKLKVIFILIGIIAVISYIIYMSVSISDRSNERICNDMIVNIKDSTDLKFISEKKVALMLYKKNINPIGLKMKEIDTEKIENILSKHPVIKEVECYKTLSGKLKIDVWQKQPMFRIISSTENCYIDYTREKIPLSEDFAAYVPLVTVENTLNNEFVRNELFDFIVFLRNNKFWESQFEQIHIDNNKEITLIPRVGNQTIHLGTLENYDKKLNKLMKLYQKAFSTGGWNQYSDINLQYKGQVICTKK